MNAFTVYKICEYNHNQLLIVQPMNELTFQICVYNEHTGQTLMRLTQPTLAEFERAIAVMQAKEED